MCTVNVNSFIRLQVNSLNFWIVQRKGVAALWVKEVRLPVLFLFWFLWMEGSGWDEMRVEHNYSEGGSRVFILFVLLLFAKVLEMGSFIRKVSLLLVVERKWRNCRSVVLLRKFQVRVLVKSGDKFIFYSY